MVSPIDYTIDVISPFQSAMQGWQAGTNDKIARADEDRRQKLFQQQQDAQKQQALQQQLMNEDLYNFSIIPNKTYDDYSNIITKYPSLHEPIQKAWEMKSEGDRQAMLGTSSQVYAALKNNNPAVAGEILDNQIKAYENSGYKQEAFNLKGMRAQLDKDPNLVKDRLGMLMRAVVPEQFKNISESLNSLEMQPYEIAKTSAETENIKSGTANNYSQIADRREGRELQKTEMYLNDDRYYAGLDQNEKQFWTKLASDERKTARELEGKPETTPERLTRLEKASGYSNAAAQALDAANNAARLAKLADSNGGAYWDRLMSKVPGTSENTFTKDVETLKSQVFLTQVEQMRGLGALTESEGAALKSSIASLDMNQGVKAFKSNLNKISLVLNRAAKKAEKNAELYATKGRGYSEEVVKAAKQRGISPAEMQDFANDLGW